jgi:hypothetical protein
MISVKLAKKISLLKWEGELDGAVNYSEINKLYPAAAKHFNCGFCIRHGFSDYPKDEYKCLNCELAPTSAGICLNHDSLYNKIEKSFGSDSDDLIKELIEVIKSIPDEDE